MEYQVDLFYIAAKHQYTIFLKFKQIFVYYAEIDNIQQNFIDRFAFVC